VLDMPVVACTGLWDGYMRVIRSKDGEIQIIAMARRPCLASQQEEEHKPRMCEGGDQVLDPVGLGCV
jgi:hypothetical protein